MNIKRTVLGVICLSSLMIMYSCASSPQQPSEFTVAVSNAGRPTAAVDRHTGIIYVAWVGSKEGRANVYLSHLIPGSEKFSAPIQINKGQEDISGQGQTPAQVNVG